ncbi:MAG: hypothetical protein HKN87_21680 [Saprospiraceae bacterium]|nr:hypothetical protein [Saprospiraceae bacterium]
MMDTIGPLCLHPDNPHYFLYKGKAMALITSAEHYGAVINGAFDYITYLQTLKAAGMNYTRIFAGTYFEIPGAFNIQHNTLAPSPDDRTLPWTTILDPTQGLIRYDLIRWNDTYFNRLHDFMKLADTLDIIVEVTLFSSIYSEDTWSLLPGNPKNNINIDHPISKIQAHTLDNGELLIHQENFVRKLVEELNEYDHFFFEIQNEPWSDHPTTVLNTVNKEDLLVDEWQQRVDYARESALAWQEKMASIIANAEEDLPKKHLIAQNYANFKVSIPEVSSNISILNFHYAWPEAVTWNYNYDKVIGYDESGFAGSSDKVYRRHAWQFMLSGGGLFNNLDYSFYVGEEEGKGSNDAPGGGSVELRFQLKVLSEFLHEFDLASLVPNNDLVIRSPGLQTFTMSDNAGTHAIYVRSHGVDSSYIDIQVHVSEYAVQFLDPTTGKQSDALKMASEKGILEVPVRISDSELALKITPF